MNGQQQNINECVIHKNNLFIFLFFIIKKPGDITMTSTLTQQLFKDNFKPKEKFNVETIMDKIGVSRPTATNLISCLLTQHAIIPSYEIGSKFKWYIVK